MAKNRVRTQAHRNADKRYDEKRIVFSFSYTPADHADGERLKHYLAESQRSANSFIKELIKRELDHMKYPYPEKDSDS